MPDLIRHPSRPDVCRVEGLIQPKDLGWLDPGAYDVASLVWLKAGMTVGGALPEADSEIVIGGARADMGSALAGDQAMCRARHDENQWSRAQSVF